ncbi:cytochrome c maturation protein CcmE [Sphingomicrobium sp. XHP0239]|uniref:cytochrome c maturation protein CcmE n=1 Tax=Sphingomicrobium maritimum TaxID=3133972 RepID=UPI0031CC64CF
MAPKQQRLVLVLIAVGAIAGAALLALWGLQGRAAFFVTPSEIVEGTVETGVPLRLGGMVEDGSIERSTDGLEVRFRLADTEASTTVAYRGITPDLFVEGSGAVAEGQLAPDGTFVADRILAKHDENYMPPELASEAEERDTADSVEGS